MLDDKVLPSKGVEMCSCCSVDVCVFSSDDNVMLKYLVTDVVC